MKSVAIFYYSMTGNTESAARAVADALPAGCVPHLIRVIPTDPDWQLQVPFDPVVRTYLRTARPTSCGERIAIATEPAEWPAADGVIIGSSTWWNHPCLPIQSLVRSERFRGYIQGKPVGLFASCRGFFRNNLHELGRAVQGAGARVVARERFTILGGLIGTMLAFFAVLRTGAPQRRWLGLRLPHYGFVPETLGRARGFAERFIAGAAAGAGADAGAEPGAATHAGLLRAVRLVFLGLALFDLALAAGLTFAGGALVPLVAPPGYGEPQFFQQCVGLFLFQYVFIQLLGALDPRRWATALTMTVAVRATFAVLYVAQLALWGAPLTALHALLAASAVLDLAATIFVLAAMARLDIGLLQGDSVAPPDAPSSKLLRLLLLVLAGAELVIGLGWLLAPRPLCDLFELRYTVDPFWTRATGVLLLNIALIQYLGARDPNRYRSAALTAGVFRALWPILYWVTAASGEGNSLFRVSIMFFSFFDLATCITIFWLIHRGPARTSAAPALPRTAASAAS